MNWLDILLLVLIAVGGLAGYRFGLVQAATTLASLVVGAVLASRYGEELEPLLSPFTDSVNAQQVAGFLLVLLVVVVAGMVVSTFVKRLLGMVMLGWVNQLAGLAMGALIVMAGASAALATVQEYSVQSSEKTIDGSLVATFLADNFDVVLRAVRILPKDLGT